MKVWLNGTFVDSGDARISAFDAGLQHAVGLFETMRGQDGRVIRLTEHLQRLATSAKQLRLTERLNTQALAEAVKTVLSEYEHDDARIRLTLTGGDLNLLQSQAQSPTTPTIMIVAQPPTPYPDQMFDKGIRVMVADARANPLDPMAGHKTLNYWGRIAALQHAAAAQCGEALWLSVTNHLAGGCVSNAFLVQDGTLHTPIARGEEESGALPAPVLPGITRQAVITAAERLGIGTARRMLSIEDILESDEVFLTNSSWTVLPVVAVEQQPIADGNVGGLTSRLREALMSEFSY